MSNKNKPINPLDTYSQRVSAELHSLPDAQRLEILAEIRVHAEDALKHGAADESALLKQLGEPSTLAAGMQHAYRPKRWLDLLLILFLLFAPLAARFILFTQFDPLEVWGLSRWLPFLFLLPIGVISIRRPASELYLYVLGTGLVAAAGAALQNPWTMGASWQINWTEMILFTFLALGLAALFRQALRKVDHDPLLVTWALLPLVSSFGGLATTLFATSLQLPSSIGEATVLIASTNLVISPLVLASFILPMKRRYRWLGLLGLTVASLVGPTIMFWAVSLWHPAYWLAVVVIVSPLAVGLWRERALQNQWRPAIV